MRIAHISDLHVLALEGAVPFGSSTSELRATRIYVSAEATMHKSEIVRAIARRPVELEDRPRGHHGRRLQPRARGRVRAGSKRARRRLSGLPPSAVTIVPGNHDVYTAAHAQTALRPRSSSAYLTPTLPSLPGRRIPAGLPDREAARPGRDHRPLHRAAAACRSSRRVASACTSSTRSERSSRSPEVTGADSRVLLHHPFAQPAHWIERSACSKGSPTPRICESCSRRFRAGSAARAPAPARPPQARDHRAATSTPLAQPARRSCTRDPTSAWRASTSTRSATTARCRASTLTATTTRRRFRDSRPTRRDA